MQKIFVGNLSFKTTAEEIHRLFIRYAEISDIALPVDAATSKPRGFAIVMIKDEAQAAAAVAALRGARLDGRTLVINPARKKGDPIPPKPERRGGSRGGSRGGGYGSGGSRPGSPRGGPPRAREGSEGGPPTGNRIRTFGSRPRTFGRPGGGGRSGGYRSDPGSSGPAGGQPPTGGG